MRFVKGLRSVAWRLAYLLGATTLLLLVLFAGVAFAQDDSPYQPAVTQVDPPSWLEPLGPLAAMPVWAIAAVLSAVVAGLVIVVPAFVRWAWTTGATRDSES